MIQENSSYRDDTVWREISPLQVTAYLRANGWKEVRQDDHTAIWTLLPPHTEPDDYYEVLVPLRPDFRDFVPRLTELFDTLEQAERRDRNEILESLTSVGADILNLRVLGDNVSNGSIPFSEAVRLTQRTYDLLQAAACSAVSPRAVYSSRKHERVRHYLESLRAGQTKRSSYVITIQSPVQPDLFTNPEHEEAGEPFERRVLRCLFSGIQAARAAAFTAVSHQSSAPFEDEIEKGISANLCEAVADLATAGGDGFEISCQWSPSRRSPAEIPPRLFVSKDVVPYIQAAARALRASSPIEDAEVRGFVERASKRTGAVSGKVVIVGDVDGQPRRVEAVLTGETYRKAVQAHKEERPIVCYGVVMRYGHRYALTSLHGFQVEL